MNFLFFIGLILTFIVILSIYHLYFQRSILTAHALKVHHHIIPEEEVTEEEVTEEEVTDEEHVPQEQEPVITEDEELRIIDNTVQDTNVEDTNNAAYDSAFNYVKSKCPIQYNACANDDSCKLLMNDDANTSCSEYPNREQSTCPKFWDILKCLNNGGPTAEEELQAPETFKNFDEHYINMVRSNVHPRNQSVLLNMNEFRI